MRVAVVGAGIVGVTTAHALGQDGHDVTVFERRASVASETSFGNAGVVAPGYVTPWAAPGMPGKVMRHLLSRHTPVRLHADLDVAWAWKWWRACRARTYRANRLRMQRLAYFSRDRLHALVDDLGIDYEQSRGYLVLLRTPKNLAMAVAGLAMLEARGARFEVVDATGCRALEPGLAADTPLHAGIHLPDDEVGDCRRFALQLRERAEALGVRFRLGATVQRLKPGPGPRVVHVRDAGVAANRTVRVSERAPTGRWHDTQPAADGPVEEAFDAVVVCAALGAGALLQPLGLRLPLTAVHGYSITAPLHDADVDDADGTASKAPRSALMDEHYKVAITRLGTRLRVAGSAELGGTLSEHHAGAIATLYKVLADWFPDAAQLRHASVWKGARPMLPDGPPVLGRSGLDGIWLNLGHGSSGWALACGSARLVADAVAGRPPAIDTEGLGIERLLG